MINNCLFVKVDLRKTISYVKDCNIYIYIYYFVLYMTEFVFYENIQPRNITLVHQREKELVISSFLYNYKA